MINIEHYMSWLMPVFQENPDWYALFEAVSEELVDLHRRQMGSSDDRGFSNVNLIPNGDFSSNDKWRTYRDPYDPHAVTMEGGDWQIDTVNKVAKIATGSTRGHSWLVRYLPQLFLNQAYRLKYTVKVNSGSFLNLMVGPVEDTYLESLPTEVGTHEVVIRIADYFVEFLAIYTDDTTVEITDVELVEEYESESAQRFSLLRRVLDIDEAPRWVLEKAQKSLSLPWYNNLPDELIRRFLRHAFEYNSLVGSTAGSALLFYLFGFSVRFECLYAHTDDYEAASYPWLPQVSYLHLVSSEDVGQVVYGKVAAKSIQSHVFQVEDGHSLLVGDLITNDDHNFENYYRRVIKVYGNEVTVDFPCDVYEDDLLSIIRKPNYPINPDSENYFSIPWVDVFVKSDILSDFEISFDDLRVFLEAILPANVNIRDISYDSEIPFHSFQFAQTLFKQHFLNVQTFAFIETVDMPGDQTTLVVGNRLPVTGLDMFGTPCDVYSYVVSDLVTQEQVVTEVEE